MSGLYVSVVVPSYRSAPTIRACLRSLLAQDVDRPFEVIVVDSSDDGTAAIVASEFPSVRLIARAERTEAPVARNLGVEEARADRLAFLDSDCVAPPDWLRRLCGALDEGYDGIGGAIANGNGDSPVSWAGYICEFREFLPGGPRRAARHMTPGNVAYGRGMLQAAGGFPSGCFPLEDQVLGQALAARSARLCMDPSIVVAHTHRTDRRAFLEHQRRFGRCNAFVLRRLSLPGALLARGRARAALALPGLVALKLLRTLWACRGVGGGIWLRRPAVAWLCGRGTWSWGRGFVEGSGDQSALTAPLPLLEPRPPEVEVSVVVATLDRPERLRECLQHLVGQESTRSIEIVVVDNNPGSGLTAPVAREFPGVVLREEPRRGLSHARNTGIRASRGEIVATTDDDVVVPPDWIEGLLVPFRGSEPGIVTGPIDPWSLETVAERAFEARGGHGPRQEAREWDRGWFDSFRFRAVPTWSLGTTANAAFRRALFSDPRIGLLDETLGSGTPSGAGEESYLFYRALKAGARIRYEPGARVRHRHRTTLAGLRRQVYDYSKGHVAYHLTTLLRDHDLRAVPQVLIGQPLDIARRFLCDTVVARSYPLPLILTEIAGYLAGPWGYLTSRRRARRLAEPRALRAGVRSVPVD